jgi:hypothetical protein
VTDPELVPALRRPPVADMPASYARYARRELEREGIPMVLALSDVRTGAPPPVDDPLALAEGARLAQLFDAYEAGTAELVAGVAAAPGPDLTGGAPLIAVLVVLAEEHLRVREDAVGDALGDDPEPGGPAG